MTPALQLVPVTIGEARKFVERYHSHHRAPVSGLCAVGVRSLGALVCVAVLGRPVARRLQDQGCAEVTRVASDGSAPHAASMAIGAIGRAAIALGWRRLVSYTLLGEAGTSYRAAGWWPVSVGEDNQFQWNCPARTRETPSQAGAKVRWEFGPDALPRDADADKTVRGAIGVVPLIPRGLGLPLFERTSKQEAPETAGRK